jgi:hypothetical protein
MRCFFLCNGHIAGVETLSGLSDQEAIAKAHLLFSERSTHFDSFELWDRARVLLRHPLTPISRMTIASGLRQSRIESRPFAKLLGYLSRLA